MRVETAFFFELCYREWITQVQSYNKGERGAGIDVQFFDLGFPLNWPTLSGTTFIFPWIEASKFKSWEYIWNISKRLLASFS